MSILTSTSTRGDDFWRFFRSDYRGIETGLHETRFAWKQVHLKLSGSYETNEYVRTSRTHYTVTTHKQESGNFSKKSSLLKNQVFKRHIVNMSKTETRINGTITNH